MRNLAALAFSVLVMLAQSAAFAQNPQVEFRTSLGNFTLELYPDKAPKTVANFLQYAKDGFYNGTIFHRIIDGFMVQGGGFGPGMQEKKTRDRIDNEAGNGLRNDTGTIAMARTNAPHSATAQFFINVANNAPLNYREPTPQGYGYAVFGRVTRGMEVVMRMSKVATGASGSFRDVPLTPVVIQSVSIVTPPPKGTPANK